VSDPGQGMLHHLSLGVADIDRAVAFYDAVLAPLGYLRVWSDLRPGEANQAVGYGVSGGGDGLALKHRPDGQRPPGPGFHVAFAAPHRRAVDDFHRLALQQGGRDHGAPGLRARYGPHYYAAFVVDLDGHTIEAVFNAAV
jgi:catechol 2,3-dioxygenase-like lactoylglutathione lyase family enzyme